MTDRELLELLVKKVTSIDESVGGINERLEGLEQRFDGLEQRFDGLEQRFDGLEQRFDKLETKVDNNHKEVMERLDTLEQNQGAIMRYMLNADSTLKKAEEAYTFVQKIKMLSIGQ